MEATKQVHIISRTDADWFRISINAFFDTPQYKEMTVVSEDYYFFYNGKEPEYLLIISHWVSANE